MRAHGALVCGTSKSDALARATRLEQVCREIYERLVPQSLTEAELAPDADGVVMSRRTCTPPDSAGQIDPGEVAAMFNSVARRYDMMNALASGGMDRSVSEVQRSTVHNDS